MRIWIIDTSYRNTLLPQIGSKPITNRFQGQFSTSKAGWVWKILYATLTNKAQIYRSRKDQAKKLYCLKWNSNSSGFKAYVLSPEVTWVQRPEYWTIKTHKPETSTTYSVWERAWDKMTVRSAHKWVRYGYQTRLVHSWPVAFLMELCWPSIYHNFFFFVAGMQWTRLFKLVA